MQTQTQASKASWQVLNFFLFQTGMVLVEALYALSTPSAGLILVSADNIVCCAGLALGLYTIRRTSQGVARRGVGNGGGGGGVLGGDAARRKSVAGFANGVLLVYVAVLVVLEAVERHIERGNDEVAHTLAVCVLGTVGNVMGLVFFPRSTRRHDHNVQGIYLHIWGNTLAFVAVALCTATSSVGVGQDELALGVGGALLVAAGIVALAVPLILRSARLLCRSGTRTLPAVADTLRAHGGVEDVEAVHIWTLADGSTAAAVRLIAAPGANDELLMRAAREAVASAGAKRCTTVVEILHSRRRTPSYSIRLNVMELENARGLSTHRRSQSLTSTRLEIA